MNSRTTLFGFAQTLKVALSTQVSHFNIKGQLVKTQSINEPKTVHNSLVWDGKNAAGKPCAAGVYVVKIQSGHQKLQGKIIKLH